MKMKKRLLTLIFLFIFIISGCSQPKEADIIEKIVFKAKVEVISSGPPQIVPSKTALDFGKLPPDVVEKKEILIKNNRGFPVVAIPHANGSISKWITFDRDRILIRPKSHNVSIVSIRINSDAKIGEYAGYVVYEIYKS
mgnify:CR=1 FL=1